MPPYEGRARAVTSYPMATRALVVPSDIGDTLVLSPGSTTILTGSGGTGFSHALAS